MAYHPKQNGVVELQSLNFPKRAQFFVGDVPEEKQDDWADHLRGAAKMLGAKCRLKVGLSGIIEGSLPIGGLSSSASVIICFLSALCKVNGIHLEPMEMILTAKAAENQYVGVSCGKLDQSCEVLSKKNHLLYLDTKDDNYELIPTSKNMKPYKVAIFFSGLKRSLKKSKYNLRQDECKAAAYALMGYAGMDYDTFANTRLRDVPFEVFDQALLAIGRSDIVLRIMIAINIVALAAVFIAVFGFNSVFLIAVGSLISSFVSLTSFMVYSNKLIGYHLHEQLKDIGPALLCSAVMGVEVYSIGQCGINKLPLLIIQVILGSLIYIVSAKILKIDAFQYLIGMVGNKIKKNTSGE